jgi:hypothetical protein
MRIITREQRHTTKTLDTIGGPNEAHIEHQKTSGETAAAPALPIDIILQRLELFYFSCQVCKFLQEDPDFRRLELRCHQIAYAKDMAESRDNIPVSFDALTIAFDCPRSRVQAAFAYGLDEPGQRGKHFALGKDREQQMVDWIRQNAEQGTPVTRGESMDYCTSQFKIKFTRG